MILNDKNHGTKKGHCSLSEFNNRSNLVYFQFHGPLGKYFLCGDAGRVDNCAALNMESPMPESAIRVEIKCGGHPSGRNLENPVVHL